jgi:DNA-binding NarL/FixJ family response regulator
MLLLSNMKNKIKIAIADDHELFRKALISLLSNYKSVSIIQEASNGKELLKSLDIKKTNIVLLDVDMPEMNGFETYKVLRKKYPSIKVVILSMHHEDSFITDLIIKGVNGFVTKGSSIETLMETINEVNEKGFYFKQNINTELIRALNKNGKVEEGIELLTAREIEILKLICKGDSHKQIAGKLFITQRTVDFHKANLYKKTNTNSTANLYEYALTTGLINTPLQKV